MYARLQIFIQLSPMKLCHIKRAYLVHNHNVRKMSKTRQNARVQTFAYVVDSFVDRCLWQVIIK